MELKELIKYIGGFVLFFLVMNTIFFGLPVECKNMEESKKPISIQGCRTPDSNLSSSPTIYYNFNLIVLEEA